ncbi:MAG: hypothetical protein JJD98_02400 [Polaromonas sp.]|nr:hypothetical protein [Polaromonas sp.]
MKNITRKTLKIAVITAAVSASLFFPFAAATAATATEKTGVTTVSQADTAAAVVSVTSTATQSSRSAGVFVGKGLVLVSNKIFEGAAKYYVTLADGRVIDAKVQHESLGLLFLQLVASEDLPTPVAVDATHQDTGANVAVFGLSDIRSHSHHPAMARGYISAPAFSFYSSASEGPQLLSAKTDSEMDSKNLGPVFSRSESGGVSALIGMTVFNKDGESYFVAADFFKPIVKKLLAAI